MQLYMIDFTACLDSGIETQQQRQEAVNKLKSFFGEKIQITECSFRYVCGVIDSETFFKLKKQKGIPNELRQYFKWIHKDKA